MDIGGLDNNYNSIINQSNSGKIENSASNLNIETATDDELKSVSKQFEAYLVEQMLSSMKKTTLKDEDEEGEYVQKFGSMLTQEYASLIAENGDFGIANKLYESMKNNYSANIINEEK